jgi:hypothetical protein
VKKIFYWKFIAAFMLVSILGCSAENIKQTTFVDDLNFENKYYINDWAFTIADTAAMKKIGKVRESHRVDKGNDIYEIEGYPKHNFIVVEDKISFTGFSIYSEYKGDGKPGTSPLDYSYSNVNQIKIYKEKELINVIKGDEVQSFITLFKQAAGPDNEFIVESPAQYHVIFLTDTLFAFKYPISDKEGEFGLPWRESKLPDQIADYFKSKRHSDPF